MRRLPTFALSALLVLCAACTSPTSSSEPAGPATDVPLPPSSLPWTSAFLEPAWLLADTVHIEGPPGLIEHFVGRYEEGISTDVKTLPEGLRQTYEVMGQLPIEVRAQLDQLTIAAMRKIVVLERPGPVDVVVEARGDVVYVDPTGRERREAVVRLVGKLER